MGLAFASSFNTEGQMIKFDETIMTFAPKNMI